MERPEEGGEGEGREGGKGGGGAALHTGSGTARDVRTELGLS